MLLSKLRQEYHRQISTQIIRAPKGYPNFADGASKSSREISWALLKHLNWSETKTTVLEQTAGRLFEQITANFIQEAFHRLSHLRPGKWLYSTAQTSISNFEQYSHLAYLDEIIKQDKKLASALGGDYLVQPDIIVARHPVADDDINAQNNFIETTDNLACLTPLREVNRPPNNLILHASISCKWTIRSDRSQNTRTEALNLIRNRKGKLPHILAVTAEPLPGRIATLALGTGDLDCVYHIALPELEAAIKEVGNEDQLELLQLMVSGKRLRDISDLPFDLAL